LRNPLIPEILLFFKIIFLKYEQNLVILVILEQLAGPVRITNPPVSERAAKSYYRSLIAIWKILQGFGKNFALFSFNKQTVPRTIVCLLRFKELWCLAIGCPSSRAAA
jgi:hypothetical protein